LLPLFVRTPAALEAPVGDFEEFLSKAQKVLDTVEWKGE
jgi:hypothetical protein